MAADTSDSTSDDRVSAELAAMRERADRLQRPGIGLELMLHGLVSAKDVPRLLAAVEAVLAMHQPGRRVVVTMGSPCSRHRNHRLFSLTADEAADVEACPDCQATVYVSCAGCGPQMPLNSCPTLAAIERALTGEDTTP